MKLTFARVSVALLLVSTWAARAASTEASAAFDAANKLYEEGKFSDAAAAYERLVQGGAVGSALYYNWGNAQYKAARLGRAIAAYRQAEQLAPRDPDVRANLRFARAQVQGPTLRPGGSERLLRALSLDEWTVATTAALWIWFGMLVLRQIRPAWSRSLRGLTGLAAVLTGLLGGALGLNLRAQLAGQTAIVVAGAVPVRNGPFEESPTAFTAQDGAELRVVDRKDDWLQVSPGGRQLGWLPQRQVVVLPAR
jgi:tetratricopeptide (TPR) repeat protein